MKKLFLLTAAAVATAATTLSCENGGGGTESTEGREARMDVRISFPGSLGATRDEGESTASDKDVAVESITVFIFDEAGNSVRGNATTFDDIENDFDVEGGAYTLKSTSRIQTTAGKRHVYVGMNLPESIADAGTEEVLTEKVTTEGLEGEGSLAMLSGLVELDLVASDESELPEGNVAQAEVKRLVSKIAVTMGEETGEGFTLNNDLDGGATYEIIPQEFAVVGLAPTFFPVERLKDGVLETPTDAVDDSEPEEGDYFAINADDATIKDFTAVYVPEHADMTQTFTPDKLTYVMVRAEVTFAKWAKVAGGEVAFEDAALEEGNFVYAFRNGDYTYFCSSKPIATGVKGVLGGESSEVVEYTADEDGKLYTYYPIFLNKDDNYAVGRNQFFDVRVMGAKGLGIKTPADIPNDPIIELTELEVEVNVRNWDYKKMDHILGE